MGDWAAVADAINARMDELGLSQRELQELSNVSKATVREIRKNIKPRNRKERILEALSKALGWHEDYLTAVLQRRTPPEPDKPFAKSPDDITGRLDVIEDWLASIDKHLAKVDDAIEDRLAAGFVDAIEPAVERVILRLRNPRR